MVGSGGSFTAKGACPVLLSLLLIRTTALPFALRLGDSNVSGARETRCFRLPFQRIRHAFRQNLPFRVMSPAISRVCITILRKRTRQRDQALLGWEMTARVG